jgi:glyoxylase-like metal-dependent hydrolase (beta-lactamase superfamily II)
MRTLADWTPPALVAASFLAVPPALADGAASSPASPGAAERGSTPAVTVEAYAGGFASVNSYIVSNGRALVVIDVQRKSAEAEKLAARVRELGLPLRYVLITHGHTDHFTGMAVFRREFPNAPIVVANEAIKRDIKAYAIYMDQGGATGAEPALDPALRPRTAANPGGFDYERTIHVLPGPTLAIPGGGRLVLSTDYPPTEAPHMATVWCPEANALFLSDLGYNKVHLWMGDDITLERIAAWRGELVKLERRWAPRKPTVYPGHGAPTDVGLFPTERKYIDDYVGTVTTATSRDAAMAKMQALYPDYREADFFLKYSVENHVRP